MFDRIISSLVALSLALLFWLYARSRDQEVLDNVSLPVRITLAKDQESQFSLDVNDASQATVSFTGPPARIHELRGQLQRNELHIDRTLTVPEARKSESSFSDTVRIRADDVPAPPGVTAIINENHNGIAVKVYRLVERKLRVKFDGGQDGPARPELKVEPEFVTARGPQEVLDKADGIPTEPAEPPTQPGASVHVALKGELDGRPVRVDPAMVTVRVPPQEQKDYVVTDVPVHFLCPADFTLRPEFFDARDGRVTVRVRGPARPEPPRVYAYIDLTHGQFLSGANHEPLRLQLPKDFQPADESPRIVPFNLQPADFVPRGLRGPPERDRP